MKFFICNIKQYPKLWPIIKIICLTSQKQPNVPLNSSMKIKNGLHYETKQDYPPMIAESRKPWASDTHNEVDDDSV